jgi:hypothetical protein
MSRLIDDSAIPRRFIVTRHGATSATSSSPGHQLIIDKKLLFRRPLLNAVRVIEAIQHAMS